MCAASPSSFITSPFFTWRVLCYYVLCSTVVYRVTTSNVLLRLTLSNVCTLWPTPTRPASDNRRKLSDIYGRLCAGDEPGVLWCGSVDCTMLWASKGRSLLLHTTLSSLAFSTSMFRTPTILHLSLSGSCRAVCRRSVDSFFQFLAARASFASAHSSRRMSHWWTGSDVHASLARLDLCCFCLLPCTVSVIQHIHGQHTLGFGLSLCLRPLRDQLC